MIKKNKLDEVRQLFEQYDYVMKTSELIKEKIYYSDIQQFVAEGLIEKVKRGYYQWIYEYADSDIVLLNKIFPDAVFCLETAAFYYRYSDRTPAQWNFAIHRDVSKTRMNIDYPFIRAYRSDPKLLELGVITYNIDGVEVKMYDKDRTVCDCLRYMNDMDKEIFNKIILAYVNDPKKNIPNLIEYAKVLRVTKKAKEWIGVWL